MDRHEGTVTPDNEVKKEVEILNAYGDPVLNGEEVVFVYGFSYNGQDYLANTTVKIEENLKDVVEWIQNVLLTTLKSVKLLKEDEEDLKEPQKMS